MGELLGVIYSPIGTTGMTIGVNEDVVHLRLRGGEHGVMLKHQEAVILAETLWRLPLKVKE